MKWNRKRLAELQHFEQRLAEQITEKLSDLPARVEAAVARKQRRMNVAATAVWVAGAFAVLAVGVYAGKEVRSRYKFKRRTPYDYYGHAGDRRKRVDVEYPVGV